MRTTLPPYPTARRFYLFWATLLLALPGAPGSSSPAHAADPLPAVSGYVDALWTALGRGITPSASKTDRLEGMMGGGDGEEHHSLLHLSRDVARAALAARGVIPGDPQEEEALKVAQAILTPKGRLRLLPVAGPFSPPQAVMLEGGHDLATRALAACLAWSLLEGGRGVDCPRVSPTPSRSIQLRLRYPSPPPRLPRGAWVIPLITSSSDSSPRQVEARFHAIGTWTGPVEVVLPPISIPLHGSLDLPGGRVRILPPQE